MCCTCIDNLSTEHGISSAEPEQSAPEESYSLEEEPSTDFTYQHNDEYGGIEMTECKGTSLKDVTMPRNTFVSDNAFEGCGDVDITYID